MMKPTSSRRGLVFAAAASALYALLVGRRAQAQEQPLDTGPDAVALAALKAELDELRRKVDRMESEKGRIPAPLQVVDEAGKEILVVGAMETGAFLRVGPPGSLQGIMTGGSVADLTFTDGSGDTNVSLRAGSEPLLLLRSEAGSANVGTLSTEQGARQGFSVSSADGTALFAATTDDRNPLVVFDKSGKPFFAVSQVADRPRVIIGDPAGIGLFAGATQTGFSMSLLDTTGERLVLRADATDTVVAMQQAGKPVAQIGTIDNTPTMILGDPAAANVTATATAGGDGGSIVLHDQSGAERATISTAGGSASFVLNRQGEVPLLTVSDTDQDAVLTLGDGAAANLTASVRANGGSLFSMKDAGQKERFGVQVDNETSSISAYMPDGVPFFDVSLHEGLPTLEVGSTAGPAATLTVSSDKTGGILRLFDDGHVERIMAKATTADPRLTITDVTDLTIMDVGVTDNVPLLTIGDAKSPYASMGVNSDRAGSFVRLVDNAGTERIGLSARASGSLVKVEDDNMFARLGSTDSSGERLGLYIGKDDTTIANLRFGSSKEGSVSVGNGGPKLVAGIAAGDEGGRFIALDGSGTKEHASLGSRIEGGYFNLSDDQGPLIHAETEGYGQFTVQGGNGSIVLIGGADAPRLELGVNEQALVQLAVTTDGVGKVLTGPGNNGPAGVLGSGNEIASSIQGKPA